MKLFSTLLIFGLFGISIIYADAPPATPPESMPIKAAQDLDYALYSHARKMTKIRDKYQKMAEEELGKSAKDEIELIKKLEKQYTFRLFDEKGQRIDTIDPDTGKITRKEKR